MAILLNGLAFSLQLFQLLFGFCNRGLQIGENLQFFEQLLSLLFQLSEDVDFLLNLKQIVLGIG